MNCARKHTLVTGASSGIGGHAPAGLDGLVNNAGYGLAGECGFGDLPAQPGRRSGGEPQRSLDPLGERHLVLEVNHLGAALRQRSAASRLRTRPGRRWP